MGNPTKRTDANRATPSVFKWDAAKEKALWLIFDGKLSIAAVAQNVAVSSRTIDRWIAHPVFKARLEAMRADLDAALRATLYVGKESRILALAEMAQRARREFEARPWLKEVRPTKDGPVTNEHFNEGAFAAFRGALDDIAKEKGERKNVAELSGEVTHNVRAIHIHYVNDWRSVAHQIPDAEQIVSSPAPGNELDAPYSNNEEAVS